MQRHWPEGQASGVMEAARRVARNAAHELDPGELAAESTKESFTTAGRQTPSRIRT